MRKILLLSAINLAVIRASQSMAACVPIPDCESLGYKYTQNICSNGSINCPFDNTKVFCFAPCFYTYTAEDCAAQCKDIGTQTCMKDNVTYYKSCGSSFCSSGQTCSNGTCVSSVAKSGYCCGYTNYCGYNGGTSSSNDSTCHSYYGRSCYEECKYRGFPDCTDMHASCRASGGTPVFQGCTDGNFDYHYIGYAVVACQ